MNKITKKGLLKAWSRLGYLNWYLLLTSAIINWGILIIIVVRPMATEVNQQLLNNHKVYGILDFLVLTTVMACCILISGIPIEKYCQNFDSIREDFTK